MSGFDNLELMFVLTAFLFQFVLIAYFAARKYAFDFAIRYGWIIYALSLPAAGVSLILLLGSVPGDRHVLLVAPGPGEPSLVVCLYPLGHRQHDLEHRLP
jgi:hypothetical protein